jgi:hypothetical protein
MRSTGSSRPELIGCTTDGEISSELGFRRRFDYADPVFLGYRRYHCRPGRGLSTDVAAACRSAISEGAKAKTAAKLPRLCIAMPEGLTGATIP